MRHGRGAFPTAVILANHSMIQMTEILSGLYNSKTSKIPTPTVCRDPFTCDASLQTLLRAAVDASEQTDNK